MTTNGTAPMLGKPGTAGKGELGPGHSGTLGPFDGHLAVDMDSGLGARKVSYLPQEVKGPNLDPNDS
jgi:hypothetical protein